MNGTVLTFVVSIILCLAVLGGALANVERRVEKLEKRIK